MAENNEEKTATTEKPASKLPVKTIMIMAAVFIIEAAAISAVWFFAGQSEPASAQNPNNDPALALEQPVEVLVIQGKFQNTRSGRPYLYDTEIYVVVKQKHTGYIERVLENTRVAITSEVSKLFRKAEPAHLLEPELSTLTRQIHAMLDRRLGRDEDGEPYIDKVLISKCTQYRSDL